MKTDAEIGRRTRLKPIGEVAGGLGVPEAHLAPYGRYAAKIDASFFEEIKDRPDAKLIVVTAMSPTPEGEGKTTLTIGLSQSLRLLGKKTVAAIRQPSLGPFFGAKGGATGGGLSQVHPADDISLHFTGDDHAVATAHNLISSLIDNHIYHGKSPRLDLSRVMWGRAFALNDRALRDVRVGLGRADTDRPDRFQISASSEVMSTLCLATSLEDLRGRIGRMLVAFDASGAAFTSEDLKAAGAATALLRHAIDPNLVQSTEGVPVFVHGGPFGNVSIGCSSLMATRMAMKLGDYVVTEAGFATDLGAEKFFDLKCRAGGIRPSAAVIVVTLRSLRYHGGAKDYHLPDMEAANRGIDNLDKHIENMAEFKVPALVVINRYADDPDGEIATVKKSIEGRGALVSVANVREEGGGGGLEAAEFLVRLCETENSFRFLYDSDASFETKVTTIAKKIYGADGVVFTETAAGDIASIESAGLGGLPVCMAKTHRSLSDDPKLTGRPRGFNITVNAVRASVGAGFLVAYCGSILLMPGLSANPRAEHIDVGKDGHITGL